MDSAFQLYGERTTSGKCGNQGENSDYSQPVFKIDAQSDNCQRKNDPDIFDYRIGAALFHDIIIPPGRNLFNRFPRIRTLISI
jgi:hypothetical protein